MNRFFKFLAVTVDVLLIIDIASDLCRKWREKKAQTPTTVSEMTNTIAKNLLKILKITIKKSGRLKNIKPLTKNFSVHQ